MMLHTFGENEWVKEQTAKEILHLIKEIKSNLDIIGGNAMNYVDVEKEWETAELALDKLEKILL